MFMSASNVLHQKMSKEWCSYNEKAPGIHWNTLENS